MITAGIIHHQHQQSLPPSVVVNAGKSFMLAERTEGPAFVLPIVVKHFGVILLVMSEVIASSTYKHAAFLNRIYDAAK